MSHFISPRDLETEWNRTTLAERVQIVAALAGGLFSFTTMIFLFVQARDTHTLAEQAVEQSKASQAQAQISLDTYKLAFRPDLEFDVPTLAQTLASDMMIVQLRNVGTAKARNVHFHLQVVGYGTRTQGTETVRAELQPGASVAGTVKVPHEIGGKMFAGWVKLSLVAQSAYDGAPAGNTRICQRFVYDPGTKTFSGNTGCEGAM